MSGTAGIRVTRWEDELPGEPSEAVIADVPGGEYDFEVLGPEPVRFVMCWLLPPNVVPDVPAGRSPDDRN